MPAPLTTHATAPWPDQWYTPEDIRELADICSRAILELNLIKNDPDATNLRQQARDVIEDYYTFAERP